MNPWYRIRRWLHRHGRHRLCRKVLVPDKISYDQEWLPAGIDPDTGERVLIDVTSWSGRPISWKTIHE